MHMEMSTCNRLVCIMFTVTMVSHLNDVSNNSRGFTESSSGTLDQSSQNLNSFKCKESLVMSPYKLIVLE